MKSDKQITALQLVVFSKQQIGEKAFEIDKRWMIRPETSISPKNKGGINIPPVQLPNLG